MSLSLSSEQTRKILSNPSFRELTAARARLRWGLSIVTLLMFFGFIGLISAASSALGKSMAGGAVPLGMSIALGMIAMVVALTGYYVRRSNTYFDGLTQLVRRECGR
ncbi:MULTISPECIES: DUF485 domain-containing protein [unclassified Bradyrhizobium]|jgi:uncharacterized membrane protein (DUF485 family)|uniref:DUF485 domain-containing protein n=1 Tax=unclassified Bradyrhizobium TaxID=2631580 RepID=UPI001FF594BF|nr:MULTISPECIES: DUF485 domain-containing protein [unclassified Bradyrhizobium]MCJ9699987.1 DUF485 domain-containing protein [Bradyrhizobium sp. SHOUNA76]MCJ9728903.1 DUF485 domain-containing protein [Bradyrhizobium sp. PRIMUS42]